jgi:formate dehydrogenase gamma subunit
MNPFRFVSLLLLFGLFASRVFPQSNDDCLDCHSDESLTKKRKGKKISLHVNETLLKSSAHSKVSCIACHTGFDPDEIPHKENITPINCTSCHNKELTRHAFHPNILSSKGAGWTDDTNCKTCHGTHEVASTNIPGTKWHVGKLVQSCGTCHADVKNDFMHSAHERAIENKDKNAPNCLTCHQNNIVSTRPDVDTLQLKIAQAKMCMSCHRDSAAVAGKTLLGAKFIQSYEKSIHGQALLQRGKAAAANCVDCHGSHQMNRAISESSLVNKMNVPHTCAKCHDKQAHEFDVSVHAASLAKGNIDAPSCTDCHGEHDILKHDDPNSPVSERNLSQQLCGTCHSSVRLSKKYGISTGQFKSFADSYHGLSVRGGALEVVNCASCHGAHDIRNSKDSTSSIHKANLVNTCGKCHPGANDRFTIGSVHSTDEAKEEHPALYWIATIYISAILTLVGGMFVHNVLDFVKKTRRKLKIQRGEIEPEMHDHAFYDRMSANERFQHGTMALSFIILVLTGFGLRYPDAWWVVALRNLSEYSFEIRSVLHRTAGVVLVAISLYHVGYVAFTKRGRQLIKDLWLRRQDLLDFYGMIKYNLGFSQVKPKIGRFGYVEKSEYWALVWGTVVMGVTGAILWFETVSMGMFTKLGWDIARTIHFYEAILATAAIIVWHFYFVIFNPDVYPMSLAWLTGKISEEEMAEEHPLELVAIKEMQARQAAEAQKVPDENPSDESS